MKSFDKTQDKKVLIFSIAYIPFVGGAEMAIKEITDRIGGIEFDMITLRFNKSWPEFQKIGNINVYRIACLKLLFPFCAFLKSRYLHKKNNYNIVWSVMANRAGFAALFFKIFNPKVKFFLTLQEGDALDYPKKQMGIFWMLLKPLFIAIFSRADYIQAISKYLADWAKDMGAKNPIGIVPNGVDINNFSTPTPKGIGAPTKSVGDLKINELKNKLNLKPDDKIIITTSRLVEKNAVNDIIEALKYLPENIKLLILGTGPLEKELKLKAKSYKLEARIIFLGHIKPREVSNYLVISDVFVRPSLSEGLGSSFLEAMAAGVPVIATPIGGIPDFLKDGETGLFCKVNNPQSIAEKVMEYINNPDRTDKIVENAQKLVREKYDWNLIAEKMRNIFNKLSLAPLISGVKILICTGIFPPDIGGPATYSKLLADELPKHGIKTEVLSFSSVRHLPKIIRHFLYFFKVLKRGRRADIVFSQDPASVGLPSLIAAKILRKKFILKIVGDYAWEQGMQRFGVKDLLDDFLNKKYCWQVEILRKIQKFVAKNAKTIIVPSEYLKKIITKWGINPEKIKVIYNAFDASELKISKEEAREKLNLFGSVLISAGRLVPWKGFSALIEIMPEILKKIPDAKLIIVGDGPQRDNYLSLIDNYSLQNNVFLTGQISHNDMMLYLRAGDIFILNTAYEGFSHHILEAMAMGISVITTNAGGNPEIIRDKDNGFLVEYNDKNAILNSIEKILPNREIKESLTREGRKSAQKFNSENMINQTISVFK